MRRRITIVVAILAVALLSTVLVLPAAAHGGMFGHHPSNQPATGTTLSLAEARTAFGNYLQQNGDADLKIGEVMQFANNFYAEAVTTSSGDGAMELLMSLDGRAIGREPGPAMMWNTAYSPMIGGQGAGFHGMMGSSQGMMGGNYGHGMMGSGDGHGMMSGDGAPGNQAMSGSGVNGVCSGASAMGYHADTATQLDQPLTADAAQSRLQTWLDQNQSGVTATDPTAFPGYFTFHTERTGQITGMVSVQAATGAIWEHTWHGDLVAMDTGS